MATITSISPAQSHSGQTLTITGTGFGASGNTVKVNFGSKAVNGTVSVTNTQVTVTIPTGCAGQVQVSVTIGAATTNSVAFFYIDTPACSFLDSNVGAASGTTTIDVYGVNLATASTVTVGTATPFSVTTAMHVGDSKLTGIVVPNASPALAGTDPEAREVTLHSPGGDSVPNGEASSFVYYATPAITAPLSPPTGAPGDTGVLIYGAGLFSVDDVLLTSGVNTFHGENIVGTSGGQIQFDLPAVITAATYDVTVHNPGGNSNTLVGAFTVV
jgi:IPT/TIG domain-containing protein